MNEGRELDAIARLDDFGVITLLESKNLKNKSDAYFSKLIERIKQLFENPSLVTEKGEIARAIGALDKSDLRMQHFCDELFHTVTPVYANSFMLAIYTNQSREVAESVIRNDVPVENIIRSLQSACIYNRTDVIPFLVEKMGKQSQDFDTRVKLLSVEAKTETKIALINALGGKEKCVEELSLLASKRAHSYDDYVALGARPNQKAYLYRCAREFNTKIFTDENALSWDLKQLYPAQKKYFSTEEWYKGKWLDNLGNTEQEESLYDIAYFYRDLKGYRDEEFVKKLWENKDFREWESERVIKRACKGFPDDVTKEILEKYQTYKDKAIFDPTKLTPQVIVRHIWEIKTILESPKPVEALRSYLETLSKDPVDPIALQIFNIAALHNHLSTALENNIKECRAAIKDAFSDMPKSADIIKEILRRYDELVREGKADKNITPELINGYAQQMKGMSAKRYLEMFDKSEKTYDDGMNSDVNEECKAIFRINKHKPVETKQNSQEGAPKQKGILGVVEKIKSLPTLKQFKH